MSVLTTKRADMCFCPGCSHGTILERLAAAIDRLARPREQVCVVSDIGCIGMADRYFTCNTFHGLHGRSVTYAEGIQRVRPDMLVVVLIGDGGCGIGTAHLVHAARRGLPIKVVVCNNFNFGMTGGQHSPTTPGAMYTPTTPYGAFEHPFDICATVAASGAAYVARFSALASDLTEQLETFLRSSGFGLVDLWELCVAYLMPQNELKPKSLNELSERLAMPFGLLHRRVPLPAPPQAGGPRRSGRGAAALAPPLDWPGRVEIRVAGSAGQHIRSAAGTLGDIAVAGGLFAAQQDDFPVTVQRGHSVSNLIVSPEPIGYWGLDSPDLLVLLSEEGARRAGGLSNLKPSACVLADRAIELPEHPAQVYRIDWRRIEREAGRGSAALAALVYGIHRAGWISRETLTVAADRALTGKYRDTNLRAIRIGLCGIVGNALSAVESCSP